VLEFYGNCYTRLLGGSGVTKSDVPNVEESNPKSTLVGDLATGDHLLKDAFDCIIMIQVLQHVYDLHGLSLLCIPFSRRRAACHYVPGIPEKWPFYWSMSPRQSRACSTNVYAQRARN
jgi:hypothetical protein